MEPTRPPLGAQLAPLDAVLAQVTEVAHEAVLAGASATDVSVAAQVGVLLAREAGNAPGSSGGDAEPSAKVP